MPLSGILSIDQGTTSSRAIVFSVAGDIIAVAQQEFKQHFPADGWVEHDPEEIWSTTVAVCKSAIAQAKEKGIEVVTVGITNQRETTVVWDKSTGKPLYNAIVWQDRRTADICQALSKEQSAAELQQKTGLLLDAYFSATKIAWILDNVDGARQLANAGKLAFGTIDTFLIWRLTGGKVHATDVTNASRTNLFNIQTLQWDEHLLQLFNVPESLLPEVKQSADDFGTTTADLFDRPLPICGVAGDQQAATIGQCCFNPGDIKSTYGTGCFVLLNTGKTLHFSKNNLLTTIAYQINGEVHYALEGSIFIAGAAVQWLRDGIKVIASAQETEALATSLPYQHGVYLVPAFAGLGAPYWDPSARAACFGMTRDTSEAHLARAALEAVCFQTHDLLQAMASDGVEPSLLTIDGGMVNNNWLCQFMADVLSVDIQRPTIMETTALGAAYLAGLQHGIYDSFENIAAQRSIDRTFKPAMDNVLRKELLQGWQRAVGATQHFTAR
ncbi:MAG: glycerol kinase GlpK [Aestuariibacter sp.]